MKNKLLLIIRKGHYFRVKNAEKLMAGCQDNNTTVRIYLKLLTV